MNCYKIVRSEVEPDIVNVEYLIGTYGIKLSDNHEGITLRYIFDNKIRTMYLLYSEIEHVTIVPNEIFMLWLEYGLI